MTDAFVYALVFIAILGPLAGVLLGMHLARRAGAPGPIEVEHTVQLLREGEYVRRTVMNFVRRARLERPPTEEDWRELADAMLEAETPEPFRALHHKVCGTGLADELTNSDARERRLVRCPHGNEWYEPTPDGVASIGCSLCIASDQNNVTESRT